MLFHGTLTSLLLFVIVDLACCGGGSGWSYHTVKDWPSKYKTMCFGTKQSPIDINTKLTVLDKSLNTIEIYDDPSVSDSAYKLTANGHTVVLTPPANKWFISFDGKKDKKYQIAQLHFHWAKSNDVGSEHTINRRFHPLESHTVSFNKHMYSDFGTAASSTGGLAVLGIMHHIDDKITNGSQFLKYGNLAAYLPKISSGSTNVPAGKINMARILDNIHPDSYYRYEGSLTTPKCTENVIWTVFKNSLPVHTSDLQLLRQITNEDLYRPTLELNPTGQMVKRVVYDSAGNRMSCFLAPFLVVLLFVLRPLL